MSLVSISLPSTFKLAQRGTKHGMKSLFTRQEYVAKIEGFSAPASMRPGITQIQSDYVSKINFLPTSPPKTMVKQIGISNTGVHGVAEKQSVRLTQIYQKDKSQEKKISSIGDEIIE